MTEYKPVRQFTYTLNTLPEDSWIIKVTDEQSLFLSLDVDRSTNEADVFVVKEGVGTACIMPKSRAEEIVKMAQATNLEVVQAKKFIPEDYSRN